ncbi:uncharacterized protein ACN427_012309 isoform 1-T1 [Glossina fuscipes fuscipes]
MTLYFRENGKRNQRKQQQQIAFAITAGCPSNPGFLFLIMKISSNFLVVWLRICDANCTFTAANIESYKTQSDVGVLKNSALSGYSTNEHYTVLECNVLML